MEPGTDPAQKPLACHESWHSQLPGCPGNRMSSCLESQTPKQNQKLHFYRVPMRGWVSVVSRFGEEKQKPPGLSFAKYK